MAVGKRASPTQQPEPPREKTTTTTTTTTMEAAAARPVIRVAAICGSLRKASYNGGLLRAGTHTPFPSLRSLALVPHIPASFGLNQLT